MSPQAKRSSGVGAEAAIQRLNEALDQAEDTLKSLQQRAAQNSRADEGRGEVRSRRRARRPASSRRSMRARASRSAPEDVRSAEVRGQPWRSSVPGRAAGRRASSPAGGSRSSGTRRASTRAQVRRRVAQQAAQRELAGEVGRHRAQVSAAPRRASRAAPPFARRAARTSRVGQRRSSRSGIREPVARVGRLGSLLVAPLVGRRLVLGRAAQEPGRGNWVRITTSHARSGSMRRWAMVEPGRRRDRVARAGLVGLDRLLDRLGDGLGTAAELAERPGVGLRGRLGHRAVELRVGIRGSSRRPAPRPSRRRRCRRTRCGSGPAR